MKKRQISPHPCELPCKSNNFHMKVNKVSADCQRIKLEHLVVWIKFRRIDEKMASDNRSRCLLYAGQIFSTHLNKKLKLSGFSSQ